MSLPIFHVLEIKFKIFIFLKIILVTFFFIFVSSVHNCNGNCRFMKQNRKFSFVIITKIKKKLGFILTVGYSPPSAVRL